MACVLASGCNSLVGNAEHDVAAVDSAAKPSSDAGSPGVWGSGGTDSGGSDGAVEGVDAAASAWDTGAEEAGGGKGEPPPIAFIQSASHDTKSSVTSVNVSYASPQRAGDLDVVVVGWSDPTNSIRSVWDSAGNPYTLAATPVSTSGVALAIYYAAHIAGGSNTVTVELDVDDFPCVAILEYSGASQVDQTAASKGSGATASSGTVMTSIARELVLGAGEPDQNGTANFSSAGPGFTQRVITGVSGMIVEDAIPSQIGSFTATGGLTTHSAWVMQLVTFK